MVGKKRAVASVKRNNQRNIQQQQQRKVCKRSFQTSRLSKNRDFLNYLLTQPRRKQSKLIDLSSKNEIDAICDCLYNAVSNPNFKISPEVRAKLKKKEKKLQELFSKRTNYKQAKTLLQKGGLLPALIPPVSAALLGFLGELVARKLSK